MIIDHWRPRIDLALTSKSQKQPKLFFELFSFKASYYTNLTRLKSSLGLFKHTDQSLSTIVTVTIKLRDDGGFRMVILSLNV